MAVITRGRFVGSEEVWQWPEFKSLAARLGIPRELDNRGLAIIMQPGCLVRVVHDFYAMDLNLPEVTDLIKERTDGRREDGGVPGDNSDPRPASQAGTERPIGGGGNVLPPTVGR